MVEKKRSKYVEDKKESTHFVEPVQAEDIVLPAEEIKKVEMPKSTPSFIPVLMAAQVNSTTDVMKCLRPTCDGLLVQDSPQKNIYHCQKCNSETVVGRR